MRTLSWPLSPTVIVSNPIPWSSILRNKNEKIGFDNLSRSVQIKNETFYKPLLSEVLASLAPHFPWWNTNTVFTPLTKSH